MCIRDRYLDEVKLIAVDHPKGTQIYPKEYMAVKLPQPEFQIFCFDRLITPLKATDHLGREVTRKIMKLDRRYAGPSELDHRFIGIAKPYTIELDFGQALSSIPSNAKVVLLAHGWVEYGYSSTNYAAYQAGLQPKAPTVSVKREGKWVVLYEEAGYPAGINHFMTLDLTGKIEKHDRFFRISSTMEIYWDRIVLGIDQGNPVKIKELSAYKADLRYRGYPKEYSPDGRSPNLYDYENLESPVCWKLMKGNYTRFGDVKELVDKADDLFVIMGHGEEVSLAFKSQAFGPLPNGFERTFILKTESYCKDMDLYTAYPETVEPLPFHKMSNYPYGEEEKYPQTAKHKNYLRRYNTRSVGRPNLLEKQAVREDL